MQSSTGTTRLDSPGSSIISYDLSCASPTSPTTSLFAPDRFEPRPPSFTIETDYSAASILRFYQSLHPLHHVLVLNYVPSVGNLQVDGELSKTEIAEAQLPTLLPGERRDSAVSLDGNTSTGAPKEDIGPRRFYVHVFQSGRFKFEPGFQSPTIANTNHFSLNSPTKLDQYLFWDTVSPVGLKR